MRALVKMSKLEIFPNSNRQILVISFIIISVKISQIIIRLEINCVLGSSFGIVTGYGLDGPGSEFRWEFYFSHLYRPNMGVHTASCTMSTGSFPVATSGRGVRLTTYPPLVPLVMKE
jgi:hypothetical protein